MTTIKIDFDVYVPNPGVYMNYMEMLRTFSHHDPLTYLTTFPKKLVQNVENMEPLDQTQRDHDTPKA